MLSQIENMNCDPVKLLSDHDVTVYQKFLHVGKQGAQEPSKTCVEIYQSYVDQLNQQTV